MVIGNIFGWIIAGLIVGILARLIVPGNHRTGLLMTILLGVVGALVGGFIGSLIFGPNVLIDPSGAYVIESAWPGWIMATLGAALVLLALRGDAKSNRLT